MKVQAEMSLYPLRTDAVGGVIRRFVDELKGDDLTVREGAMSTTLAGGVDEVLAAVGNAFKGVAHDHEGVLVLKVSNACPSIGPSEGNSDVEQSA